MTHLLIAFIQRDLGRLHGQNLMLNKKIIKSFCKGRRTVCMSAGLQRTEKLLHREELGSSGEYWVVRETSVPSASATKNQDHPRLQWVLTARSFSSTKH